MLLRILFVMLLLAQGCSCLTHGPRSKEPGLGSVQNLATIEEGKLYRGARPSSAAVRQLRQTLGIKSIINLDEVHDDCDAIAGLRYFHFPSYASARDRNARQIMLFLKTMEDPGNYPIYLHCNRGADRTGEFIAAYRVVVQQRPLEEAYAEMDRHLFCELRYGPLRSQVRIMRDTREAVLRELEVMPPTAPVACGTSRPRN